MHGTRSVLTGCAVALAACVLALVAVAPAFADPYGQLRRFALKPNAKPGPYTLTPRTAALGVDAEEGNAVYVAEEAPEVTNKSGEKEPSGAFRIQKYGAAGELLAETNKFNPPTRGAQAIEGVAVDHALGRVYVLALFERTKEPDSEESAAGTLYTFKTSNLESAVAEEKGILVNSTTLRANGTPAEALLNPTGIAVDAGTHEVALLGEVDEGGPSFNRHLAVQRVSSAGALTNRYVEEAPESEEQEVNSPVITPAGTLLAQRSGSTQEAKIIQIPSVARFSRQTVFQWGEGGRGVEELVEFNTEAESRGAGLALVPGAEKTGSLWSASSILEQKLSPEGHLEAATSQFPGALELAFKEGAEGRVSASELGWTGGQNDGSGLSSACTIAERNGTALGPFYPLVAAGAGGAVFMLSSTSSEVVELGPGGTGCPHPTAGHIFASAAGGPTSEEVPPGEPVSLYSETAMGNVSSAEWSFGDGSEPAAGGLVEYQLSEATHEFEPGTFKVAEKVKTDDLAWPSVSAERTLIVSKYAPSLTTALAGEGQTGALITVKEGAAVADTATLAGKGAAGATGTVTYKVYSDEACTQEVAVAGSGAVSAGSAATSGAVVLPVGTYYWRAFYGGDGKDLAASDGCRSEIETVEARPSPQSAASPVPGGGVLSSISSYRVGLASTSLSVSASGAVSVKVQCLGSSGCAGTVTLRTLSAVSSGAGKRKAILTLAKGSFSLAGGQTRALTLHLSGAARKLLGHSHMLRARATIVARDSSGVLHVTPLLVTLREKRHH